MKTTDVDAPTMNPGLCGSATDCALIEALKSTSTGFMVTDRRLRIVLANDAFLAATGHTLDNVIGQHPCMLGSGKRDRMLFRSISRSIEHTGQWTGQIVARDSGDRVHPLWMQIDAVRDPQGEVLKYVAVLSDLTRFGEVSDDLYHLAYHDALTGLPNRKLLQDRLEQAIAHARRACTGFALLFIDLDGFKEINDRLGHSTGDRLLIEVARRLRAAVRESDTVARLAGDEFVLILNDAHKDTDTATVAAKIITSLCAPLQDPDGELRIAASIGIARFPHDGRSAEVLIEHADRAMYRAKRGGGAGYCFHADAPGATHPQGDPLAPNCTESSAASESIMRSRFRSGLAGA